MNPKKEVKKMDNKKMMKQLLSIPHYPITLSPTERSPRNAAEQTVQGIRKTTDVLEVAEKLSSGNWIAFDAETSSDGVTVYVLGWV